MLHPYLKERTSTAHQALEKKMVILIKQIRTEATYVQFLKLMYGYYAAVEAEISNSLETENSLDFKKRRKADRLLDDIRHFGETSATTLCNHLPLINSYPRVLGALYVLEGSVLGGKIIAGMISSQLGLESHDGLSFFMGYSDDTPAMWESFKQYLNKPFTDPQQEEIIQAANDTFTAFRNWIEQQTTA